MCRESAALLGAGSVDLTNIRFFEESAVAVLVVSQRKALAVVTQLGAGFDELIDGDVQIFGHCRDVRIGELDLPRPFAAVATACANVNVALFRHFMALSKELPSWFVSVRQTRSGERRQLPYRCKFYLKYIKPRKHRKNFALQQPVITGWHVPCRERAPGFRHSLDTDIPQFPL